MLDQVESKKRELLRKHPNFQGNPALMYTLVSLIKTIDGKTYDSVKLERIVKDMSMADSNKILQYAMKLNSKVGINSKIENTHLCRVLGK